MAAPAGAWPIEGVSSTQLTLLVCLALGIFCAGLLAGHLGGLGHLLMRLGLRRFSVGHMSRAWRQRHDGAIAALAQGLQSQDYALTQAGEALEQQAVVLGHLREQMASLGPAAQTGLTELAEAEAAQNTIGGHLGTLRETLTQTGTSLEEMIFSSNEVVGSIRNLSSAAEQTAVSINEMDVSMAQVVSQANSSSELSEKVSHDAEAGVTAIKQTVEGIDKIKVNNRLAADAIGRLRQCIDEVSTVLSVIDDVAEQTNLLALNAAIIAAQAGDHGRGFAVVADEIKALAERTGTSTQEISDIILRIQEHSRRVTDVVTTGVADVDAGMQLGQHAEDALQHVVSSAQRSMVMMRSIAQATIEHAKGAKKINSAMSQVTETMAQIYYATSEQARGSEVVIGNISTMQNTLVQSQDTLAQEARLFATWQALCADVTQRAAQATEGEDDPVLMQARQAVAAARAVSPAGRTLGAHLGELSALTSRRL